MTDRSTETAQPSTPSITLHSSWRGIVIAALGVTCLVALAIGVTAANGVTPVTLIIDLAVLGALLVVLFDMPIATTFDAEGFTRSTPLRRHRVRWGDVRRLERMRVQSLRRGSPKGLVALRRVRPILLVDRTEGFREHLVLCDLVGPDVVESHFEMLDEPRPQQLPTWTGRRSRWAPEQNAT